MDKLRTVVWYLRWFVMGYVFALFVWEIGTQQWGWAVVQALSFIYLVFYYQIFPGMKRQTFKE